MINTTSFYSYDRKEPYFLPHRIRLSNGLTKTDITTFTEDDLNDAGYTGPYEKPNYDEKTEYLLWNNETLSWDILERPDAKDFSPPTPEEILEMIRAKRNHFLFMSDWTQLPDSGISDTKIVEWKKYRQLLRDVPQQKTFDGTEDSIVWPNQPN